jgi:hypothetical protein
MHTTRALFILLAVAFGVGVTAPGADAQVGGLTVKGKRWVNGNEAKVKCIATDGHTLDASVQGQRTFTFTNQPDCFIFNDAESGSLQMIFTGEEEQVLTNGNPKPFRQYALTNDGTAPLEGAIGGKIKCAPDCKTDKGEMFYSRNVMGTTIIFIGKYKAGFE